MLQGPQLLLKCVPHGGAVLLGDVFEPGATVRMLPISLWWPASLSLSPSSLPLSFPPQTPLAMVFFTRGSAPWSFSYRAGGTPSLLTLHLQIDDVFQPRDLKV